MSDPAATNASDELGEHVGIRQVRHEFRGYLDRVLRGEQFVITDHGRPVGRLVPLQPHAGPLARMAAEGRLVPAVTRIPSDWVPPGDGQSTAASDELLHMRDQERNP